MTPPSPASHLPLNASDRHRILNLHLEQKSHSLGRYRKHAHNLGSRTTTLSRKHSQYCSHTEPHNVGQSCESIRPLTSPSFINRSIYYGSLIIYLPWQSQSTLHHQPSCHTWRKQVQSSDANRITNYTIHKTNYPPTFSHFPPSLPSLSFSRTKDLNPVISFSHPLSCFFCSLLLLRARSLSLTEEVRPQP